MRRIPPIKLMGVVLLLGAILWGNASCGGPEPTATSEVAPSPTDEAFESPILPTPDASGGSPTDEAFESPILPTPTAAVVVLPEASPPVLKPEAGLGAATGAIVAYPSGWGSRTLYAFFSPFYSGDRPDEGFFVLEPSVHPRAEVSLEGSFGRADIPPAKYVIVVGPSAEEAIPISDGGRPRIFEIVEGQVLEIGPVDLTQ
jgi:hypothetical protein